MAATGYVTTTVVTSVQGETGAVVLDAGDVDAVALAATVAGPDTLTVNRPATGAEEADIWEVSYGGSRGQYANGYGCGRDRVPAHADAANQVAHRAACHSSKDGTAQVISAAALSDNTHMSETRANGEWRVTTPRWLEATLGTDITAGTAVAPATVREGSRVYARGTLAWEAVTLSAGSVLVTVHTEHRPATDKRFSVRTSPNSNVASQLLLSAADGTITNLTGFGTTTTANVGLDDLSWDLS